MIAKVDPKIKITSVLGNDNSITLFFKTEDENYGYKILLKQRKKLQTSIINHLLTVGRTRGPIEESVIRRKYGKINFRRTHQLVFDENQGSFINEAEGDHDAALNYLVKAKLEENAKTEKYWEEKMKQDPEKYEAILKSCLMINYNRIRQLSH